MMMMGGMGVGSLVRARSSQLGQGGLFCLFGVTLACELGDVLLFVCTNIMIPRSRSEEEG